MMRMINLCGGYKELQHVKQRGENGKRIHKCPVPPCKPVDQHAWTHPEAGIAGANSGRSVTDYALSRAGSVSDFESGLHKRSCFHRHIASVAVIDFLDWNFHTSPTLVASVSHTLLHVPDPNTRPDHIDQRNGVDMR